MEDIEYAESEIHYAKLLVALWEERYQEEGTVEAATELEKRKLRLAEAEDYLKKASHNAATERIEP